MRPLAVVADATFDACNPTVPSFAAGLPENGTMQLLT
jgi:hypothetical protein